MPTDQGSGPRGIYVVEWARPAQSAVSAHTKTSCKRHQNLWVQIEIDIRPMSSICQNVSPVPGGSHCSLSCPCVNVNARGQPVACYPKSRQTGTADELLKWMETYSASGIQDLVVTDGAIEFCPSGTAGQCQDVPGYTPHYGYACDGMGINEANSYLHTATTAEECKNLCDSFGDCASFVFKEEDYHCALKRISSFESPCVHTNVEEDMRGACLYIKDDAKS